MIDSLDEYHDLSSLLVQKLDTEFSGYKNMKVIFTTRLIEGFPKQLKIEGKDYVRLLPFTEEQTNSFLEFYKINLTFKQAIDLGIRSQELTKPLLLFMLKEIFPAVEEDIMLIKNDSNITPQMYHALFYLHFIHNVVEGKDISKNPISPKNKSYAEEKHFLRLISILHEAYGGKLSQNTLEKYKKQLNVYSKISDFTKILSTYFFVSGDEEFLEFNHKTYKEFLMAEKYLEVLIKDTNYIWLLNAGIPSEVTSDFLSGLIGMMKSNNPIMRKCIEYSKAGGISLLNSFDYQISIEEAKQKIIFNARTYINSENIVMASLDDNNDYKQTKNPNGVHLQNNIEIPFNRYENLWLYRWISLFVLMKLDATNDIDNLKLLNLIMNTRSIPSYLRLFPKLQFGFFELGNEFKGIDLSYANILEADFSGAKLARADFSGARIAKIVTGGGDDPFADFRRSTFSNANLVSSNKYHQQLDGVILIGVDFSYTNLSGVGLSHSDLRRSNLTGTILTQANLSGSLLSESALAGVDLSNANLSGSIITRCDQSGSDYYDGYYHSFPINLSGANLSGTDFSYSNVSGSIIIGCRNFDDLKCEQTNFDGSIIDNDDLVCHLRQHGAIKVPNAETKFNKLEQKLVAKGLDKSKVQKILKSSSLYDP